MIRRSVSLEQRLLRETVRHAGSLAMVVHYRGNMPCCCEFAADGERVTSGQANETAIRTMAGGSEPPLEPGATYWRLLDNGGNVVMQGDGA